MARKTLKSLVAGFILGTSTILGSPGEVEAQKQDNFYFETKENNIAAWLCKCPKEEKKGVIWFYYKDTDNDKFYDNVLVQKNNSQIKTKENFQYNVETKKLNYQLTVYDLVTSEKIIEKYHKNISREEAKDLGEDFVQRIKEFVEVQKDFSRFNPEPLENLVRKENYYKLKIVNEKLVGNLRTPIEKILSKEEIGKVEDYYSPVGKARRKEEMEKKKAILEKEIEEGKRMIREMDERERMKREMKKLSKTEMMAKISGGLMKTVNSSWKYEGKTGLFFEITPQLNITNLKNRGIAVGLDLWLGNSEFFAYGLDYDDDKEPIAWWAGYGAFKYRITKTETKISRNIENSSGIGLNLKYTSPSFEVFFKSGISRQKVSESTTIEKEECIEEWGVIQDSTRTKSQETEQNNYGRGVFYGGLGMEIFPFPRKENPIKNLSFFIEGLYIPGKIIIPNMPIISERNQFIFKAGIKYVFRK